MIYAVKIHENDTVAVMPEKVSAGEAVGVTGTNEVIKVLDDIPAGHKIALVEHAGGDWVIKYGIRIGKTSQPIKTGQHVHSQNLINNAEELCTGYCEEYKKNGQANPVTDVKIDESRKLNAYPRKNGSFGIRNYIMIFSTSLAANQLAEELSNNTDAMWWACDKRTLENGQISDKIKQYLVLAACNPNIYAAMIVGSGEQKELNEALVSAIKEKGMKPVCFKAFSEDTHDDIYGESFDTLMRWKKEADALQRTTVPFSGFTMAIHCAGSDWTTALFGNPTLGVASDLVTKHGGYVIQDEWGGFPGSEHILASHAVSHELGCAIIDKVKIKRDKVLAETGHRIEEINPFPSNLAAGITTLVEKSHGNIAKAGTAPIQGILEIGDKPSKPGIYIQDQWSLTPYSTGTFAALAGCHLNVLVSGVGYNYFELPYMPVIRETGNTQTFKNEKYKLDFNAGEVMEGRSISEVGQDLFDYICAVAEGEDTKCEIGKARGTTMYNEEDEYNQKDYCRYKAWRINVMDRIRRVGKEE